MTTTNTRTGRTTAARDTPVARTIAADGAAEGPLASASTLVFGLYLVLVIVEYGGLSAQIPILRALRFTTVLSYALFALVARRARLGEAFATPQVKMLGALLFMTVLSVAHADVQTYAFNAMRPMFESILFMIVTAYVLDRRSRVEGFAAVLAAIAAVLVARNLSKLGQDARVGAFAAPYFMGDGNDFAWATVIILPLALALVVGRTWLPLKAVGLAGAGACVLAIVGTQSRGGTIALAATAFYGWWFVAQRRALGAAAVVVLALGVMMVAPAGYFNRMQTVSGYEEDNSAQARLQAWGAAIRMAGDYPLGVGAGNFNSAYGRHYNTADGRVGWGAARWVSAHSIYFKVLGEYGFLGLGLLIALIVCNIRSNVVTRRLIREAPGEAPLDDRWPAFVNMSVIGFAVAGAFLTGVNYPHMFLLTGCTLALRRLVELERRPANVPLPAKSTTRPAQPDAAERRPGGARPVPAGFVPRAARRPAAPHAAPPSVPVRVPGPLGPRPSRPRI